MEHTDKYTIVTGITTEYKDNPQNPKYFAKFINDDLLCYGRTEAEAVEHLKRTFTDYKEKNKLFPPSFDKVLNSHVSREKFEIYFYNGISFNFFELIGEDGDIQLHDETTIKDLELTFEQIQILNQKYQLNITQEDIVVDIFACIHKGCA
jgi:hypothetical protein